MKGQRERSHSADLDPHLMIVQRSLEHGKARHDVGAEVHPRLAPPNEDALDPELASQDPQRRAV